MSYLAILGRQPAISLAELESLYDNVQRLDGTSALVTADEVNFARLGGTVKLAKLLIVLPTTRPDDLLDWLSQELLAHLPDGKKLTLGLSMYGKKLAPKDHFAFSLKLKNRLKSAGRSVRIVPGSDISAAQIIHNDLLTRGADIVAVVTKTATYIGLTCEVQDIERYALRDHGRPARSAKVGMLPPKLAQIMINLTSPAKGDTVLDPFCGTGVILQEALLMGFKAYGSDIDPHLIKMSEQNLQWLAQTFGANPAYRLEVGDATTHSWRQPVGAVVTEGYLGPALLRPPTGDEITQLTKDARQLTLAFLKNLRSQLAPGINVCLSLPAWKSGKTFQRLNLLDQIEALGYTAKQFSSVRQADLLYHRPDQIVARELVVVRSI